MLERYKKVKEISQTLDEEFEGLKLEVEEKQKEYQEKF